MKMMFIPKVIGALGTVTKGILKESGGFGNKRTREDHPNNCFIAIGQNTKKSPGDFRKLAATQTSVKDYQLTLMWKTLEK